MPFIIQHLIPEKQNLVTVTESDSAQDALLLMIEHDFSQLPVIDATQKLKGMVTSDSILRAVNNLRSIPERLKVSHAITRVTTYRMENELSDLLRGLQNTNAIPIVDNKGQIQAIVTSYDTAEYFRRRAEDLMLAEDIELTLRDFIKPSNTGDCSSTDDDNINQLIQAITPSNQNLKEKFKQALLSYIGTTSGSRPQFDQNAIDSVFSKYLEQSATQKTFDDLTLYELTQIFKNIWPQYQAGFNDLEWEAIDPLLEGVRETRNAIAHFREVTPQQRRQLQYCANLLDNHRPSFEPEETAQESAENTFRPAAHNVSVTQSTASGSVAQSFAAPPEEELEAGDSRYAPLAIWLQQQDTERVTCTFKEVESIIDDELPPSAYNNRSWWANDRVGHVQSKQWLDVDWRVSSVNMSTERVVFSRMGDRQSSYVNFFNQLQDTITHVEGLQVQPYTNPQGKNWSEFLVSPNNCEQDEPRLIGFAFSRRARFRIEIYINEQEQEQNKQIFERLYEQKAKIEKEFGAELSWERLRGRHGSRIACYRQNSSIDNTEELDEIRNWAVETLPQFFAALYDRFTEAKKTVQGEEYS